jgi:hypothetical protein
MSMPSGPWLSDPSWRKLSALPIGSCHARERRLTYWTRTRVGTFLGTGGVSFFSSPESKQHVETLLRGVLEAPYEIL